MESPIELLKRLIDEGEKFNFQNFCFPLTDHPGRYGGDDTPEWLAWKTRCRNLITPDDMAYTIDQDALPDGSRKKEKRARPNVIFEFGFFVGKLGRERVCCLHKEGVVLPSDLSGLVYKKIDGSVESQGMAIIKELKAAGYKIQI
jgi:hypothetical protein